MRAGRPAAGALLAALGLAGGPALAAAPAAAAPAGVRFEQAFKADRAAPQLHYTARYQDARGAHTLQAWRDGERRIRRQTDGRLDLLALHDGHGDVALTLFDHDRKLRTDVSRTGLAHVGQFSDWFGLAHALAHPTGPYTLQALGTPASADRPAAPCRWWQLQSAGRTSAICWSERLGLPMLITGADGSVRWRVQQLDTQPLAASAFAVADVGYARVNANDDLVAD